MGFKDNLKRLREKAGLTQAQAAAAAGVAFRSYQNWEAGVREPRLDALKALAEAFRVPADDLLKGVDAPAKPPARARPKKK